MKYVYLILTQTDTYISRIIRHYTGDRYNHISVALEEDLSEMYSFGRRNPYIFFYGGFIVENPTKGTFKRFPKTICKVLRLSVTEDAYKMITEIIRRFLSERKSFKYNIRGILKARKRINYQKSYRKFYCTQFVKYLLLCARVVPESFFGEVVAPEDFAKIENAQVIYEGFLREYQPTVELVKALSDK